jgi:hypothetical protein
MPDPPALSPAAADLLAACKAALAEYDRLDWALGADLALSDLWDQIRRAVAKAEGRDA